jgi:hypothetical protein
MGTEGPLEYEIIGAGDMVSNLIFMEPRRRA